MKKFSKTKNGRQVHWTLHAVLLGGQQVVSTGSTIIAKLQSFRYEGNRKNVNFDKYVNLHVEQHNQQSDLQEYGVGPLAENLKTLWFQDSIKCNFLDAVKESINANCSSFTDFDPMKEDYVDFKRKLGPTNNPKTCKDASVGRGGCGGGSRSCQPGPGQGHQTNDNHQTNLVPQAEVDNQSHITLRYYSHDVFK
jgi:hypothetical protein